MRSGMLHGKQIRREAAVAELRSLLPGFTGRLDGGRLHVTPAEARLLAEVLPYQRGPLDSPVVTAALDVVVDR